MFQNLSQITPSDDQYFEESLRWYEDIFVAPSIMRIMSIWFILINTISLLLVSTMLSNAFPIKEVRHIVIYGTRELGADIKLTLLNKYGHPIIDILSKTVENYVRHRESIEQGSFDDVMAKKYNFVRTLSSDVVNNDFMNSVNKNQEKIKEIVSQSGAQIEIVDSGFIGSNDMIHKIFKYFLPTQMPTQSWVDFRILHTNNPQIWRARLQYSFNLPRNHTTSMPIYFHVKTYSVSKKPIKQTQSK